MDLHRKTVTIKWIVYTKTLVHSAKYLGLNGTVKCYYEYLD